jgi:hypothetical protein
MAMSPSSKTGFLVVLRDPGERHSINALYTGVDRLPPYAPAPYSSHYPEEAGPLDAYVFGAYKDRESGLITDYSIALELWQRFRVSRRIYEILLVCPGSEAPILTTVEANAERVIALGYDVAGIGGDCWSIVGDFSMAEWAKAYTAALNESGLFRTRDQAEHYLKEYRQHHEADSDLPFDVVLVSRVIPRA